MWDRVDIGRQRYATHVHFKDLLTTTDIWQTDHNLTVETAWTQQRGVKNVWTVSCRNHNDAFIAFEAIHLNQHLVQRLFAFVITAAHAGAAMAADCIDFVDENNRRAMRLGLVE